MIYKDNAYM